MSNGKQVAEDGTIVKFAAPLYVCMSNFICQRPPIAHRGGDAKGRVTPFEFAMLAGVLNAARATLSQQHFDRAWRAGGAPTIKQQRQHVKQFRDDWEETKRKRRRGASKQQAPAPRMRHAFPAARYYENENERNEGLGDRPDRNARRPLMRRKLIKAAGREGFKEELRRQRQAPAPDTLAVPVSRYTLLRCAGLADSGPNRAKIDAALDRLCQPIADTDGVLIKWRSEKHGLQLQVRGAWLNPPFERLPMPLPKSANVLALYLWLNGINTGYVHRNGGIDCGRLFELLGLSWRRFRHLQRALDLVNAYLDRLSLDYRKALAKCRIELPHGYEIEPRGNAVCFHAIPFQWHDDETDEIEADDSAMDDMGDAINANDSDDDEPDHKPIPRVRPLTARPKQPVSDDDSDEWQEGYEY